MYIFAMTFTDSFFVIQNFSENVRFLFLEIYPTYI